MNSERWLTWLVTGLGGLLALALAVTNAGPTGEGPDRDAAAHLVALVNEARAAHDLPALVPADDVTLVAEAWSARMADGVGLEHNPDHAAQICCWSSVSENVAWSSAPRLWSPGDVVTRVTEELHEGLLSSPGHRANLLHPTVDQIGVGVHVGDDGQIWITQNFRRLRPG